MIKNAFDINGSNYENAKISSFTIFLLTISLFYQAFFCFVNTHIFSIKPSYLVLTEMILLGIVSIFFIRGPVKLSMASLMVFVFANSFVLALFQQFIDPKTIRNLMIPILMIWIGTQYTNKLTPNDLFKRFSIIVVAIGLFEFVLPDIYQNLFNVINYHISIGRATEDALKYVEGGFSLNGTRWGGRNLLPFLGDHRSSSVFLETVNMGNFGVLLGCWGLSRNNIKDCFIFLTLAIIVAVLADSRFASILIISLVFLRFLPIKILEIISYLSPLVVLFVCFYFQGPLMEDDLKGRLGSTGFFILNFSVIEFFGLSSKHYSKFVDQGYANLFHFSGIILSVVFWISFCRLSMSSMQGRIFKSFIGILIAANLAISGDSMFAFKWVALLWFLVGTELKKINSSVKKNEYAA